MEEDDGGSTADFYVQLPMLNFGLIGHGCLVRLPLGFYGETESDNVMDVTLIWGNRILDLIHSAFVCCSLFFYFILWFGKELLIDRIPWSVLLPTLLNL